MPTGATTKWSLPTGWLPSIPSFGLGNDTTAVCDGGEVTISGVSNVYEISGHCATVVVSGSRNRMTVDSADAIVASGMATPSPTTPASPPIDRSGMDNSVERG